MKQSMAADAAPDWSIDRSGVILPPAAVRDGRFIFGLTDYSTRTLYLPWLPPVMSGIRDLHEFGHTWGIDGCADPSCLMYEGGDDLREKLVSWPRILWRRATTGGWFCPVCRRMLEGK